MRVWHLTTKKTKILSWEQFLASIGTPEAGDDAAKEEFATEKLFWAAYTKDDGDPEALEALMLKDLSKELEHLLEEPYWDMGQIRIVLHAMRLVRNSEVAGSFAKTYLD